MAEPAEICDRCSKLISSTEALNLTHYPNIGLLRRSSLQCTICKMIEKHCSLKHVRERLPDFDEAADDLIPLEMKILETRSFGSGLEWAKLEVRVNLPSLAQILVFYISIATCESGSSASSLPIWNTATTSKEDKISTVKSWLQDCELNHPDCRPKGSQMPERFIDVGSLEGHPARIVKYSSLDSPLQRYATLSYCWGDNSFRTTKETEALYSKEIPWDLTPATFQDALSIARALGIQYLWIDALCIVQDDLAEWEKEAAKMQGIYSGSSLTIAATDAFDSSGGCFFDDDGDSDLHSIDSNIANARHWPFISVRNAESERAILVRMQSGDVRESTNDSVLNTRGWVLQEMILSPRTVHCMRRNIYWHCKTGFKSETGIEFDGMSVRKSPISNLHQAPSEWNKIWWKWMENYSSRSFTIPEDRLPAMAGLVRHYQAATGDIPVLGLWEGSLHQDLLWMRVQGPEGKAESPPINMPSWSWLSCSGRIAFDFWQAYFDLGENVVSSDHGTIMEWDVTWTSDPLVSTVKSTRLIINAPVRELRLSVAPEATIYNPPYFNVEDEKVNLADQSVIPWRCAGQFDGASRITPAKYLCLLLRVRKYKDDIPKYATETFLILEPAVSPSESYRRVGIAFIHGDCKTFDLNIRQTLNLV